MFKKIGLFIATVTTVFAMHSAEININDEDLEVAARFDVGQFDDNVEPEKFLVGIKYLNGSDDNSDVNSVDDYYEVSLLLQGQMENENLVLGLGIKLNKTKGFSSVPLGIEASYRLPADMMPIYLNGMFYYAPSVLTLEDADSFLEYRVGLDFEVIEDGRVLVGYRVMNTDYDDIRGDVEYNKSAYIGFKFAF